MGALVLGHVLSTRKMTRTEEAAKPRRSAQAVLLPAASSALQAAFPPVHPVVKAHHMTVAVDPQGKTLALLATSLRRAVDLNVVAVVSDAKCQAAVVQIHKVDDATAGARDDDGGVPVPVENLVAHVTLSLAPNVPAVYSNELLERVLLNGNGFLMDWDGTYKDGSAVSVRVPKEPLRLSAVLCLSDLWDEAEARCGAKKECGFCLFMKLGPCGDEFQKWEDCIESCKDSQEDFIDKCAQHTLALKGCVDVHPEYYYSLMDESSSSSSADASDEATADATAASDGELGALPNEPVLVIADETPMVPAGKAATVN